MTKNDDYKPTETAAHNTENDTADTSSADERGGPSMLDIALAHARQGMRVFPVVPGGKVPAIGGWNHRATSDPEVIRGWWSRKDKVIGVDRERDFNIGVATGHGVAVLDVDVKHLDGFASLKDLVAETGLPDGWDVTRTVRTASGGVHLYFKTTEDLATTASKIGPGLDTRGAGGYVLAAGSIVNGKPYVLEADLPLASVQPALAAVIGKPTPKQERATMATGAVLLDNEAAINRAKQYLEQRAGAVEGEGGDDWTFKTAAAVKDLGLSELGVLELMFEHWNKKCDPAWTYEELAMKVANAFSYGHNAPGSRDPANDFDKIDDDDEVSIPKSTKKTEVRLSLLMAGDIAEPLNDLPTLIDDLIDANGMTVVYGASNSGKTFVALSAAMSIAAGATWGGRSTTKKAVLYVALEGDHARTEARVKALKSEMKLGDDVPFALAYVEAGILDLVSNTDGAKAVAALAREMAEKAGIEVGLIVIDTLSRAFAGRDENTSTDMGSFVLVVDQLRKMTKAHVLIVHHSGKQEAAGARGHTSLRAATDTEFEVKGDGTTITMKNTKQRFRAQQSEMAFRLRDVAVWPSRPGRRDITSAVLDYVGTLTGKASDPAKSRSKDARVLYMLVPADGSDINKEDLLVGFVEAFPQRHKKNAKSLRTAFRRTLGNLIKDGAVREKDERISRSASSDGGALPTKPEDLWT